MTPKPLAFCSDFHVQNPKFQVSAHTVSEVEEANDDGMVDADDGKHTLDVFCTTVAMIAGSILRASLVGQFNLTGTIARHFWEVI